MDPKEIQKLAKVLRDQGDKLLTSEFKFTVTGELLRALNDSFSLIVDEHETLAPQTFQVTKPNYSKSNVFRELMFIYDFIQKTLVLRITKFIDELDESCIIDISKFRNLTTLEIHRVPIKQIKGLQSLRIQLQELVVEKCLTSVKELIIHCAGDKCSGFIWNNLKRLDLSYNQLDRVESSFEFTPYIQHLNLSHNKIVHISALVWLPNLKVLNLSFNQLTTIPKLNNESMRRLQVLTLNDNCIEDVSGAVRLEALLELDISGNCLLDHALLLPLCTLSCLRYLNLFGNPLAFHPKHRIATCRYLSKNAASVQFYLDGEILSRNENSLTGNYENYYPLFGHRMQVASSTRASSNLQTPTTKSFSNTPDNTSLDSNHSSIILNQSGGFAQKIKVRNVVIEDREKTKEIKSPTKKLLREGSKDHLETKREIEELRKQYGNEWLFNQDTVMGLDQNVSARRRLELGDILSESPALTMDDSFERSNNPLETSTPQETTLLGESSLVETLYKSIEDSATTAGNSIYASALEETLITENEEEEIVISEPEDGEVQFLVVDEFTKEDFFLTLSETTIKEKDAMTGRTLIKWGISTLASVERIRSELIRLTFDTIRKDKRERQYRMELKCCQELEKLLRDYLASRSISDMNQTIYKCVKCNSQFCREIDERKYKNTDVRCPSCGNKYVIELPNSSNLSPPKPLSVFLTETVLSSLNQKPSTSKNIEKQQQVDTDIPKTNHSFSSIESAFDSNQSVAGSSVEILSECSSSHISHTSQSSIEVLDPFGSRKASEERRISTAPSLDTIDDDGTKLQDAVLEEDTLVCSTDDKKVVEEPKIVIGNVNLTESSSSGESVQTAYEQNGGRKKKSDSQSEELPKSSPLESIFKTSQLLLSKSKKKEVEPVSSHPSKPIQYNYEDLSALDHRLKLFCFQNVLDDNDEKIMWLVKCIVVEEMLNFNPKLALLLMTTRKIYILKICGDEQEDISTWIQKSPVSHAIDNVELIQALPFANGFTFKIKNAIKFHVILRDDFLSSILQKHITTSNQTLEIIHESSEALNTNLMRITDNNELKYLSIFKSCNTSICSSQDADTLEGTPLKSLNYGMMLVTTEAIHLVTNFKWLCDNAEVASNEDILTQPMTNLVELDNLTNHSFTLNFMDELENTIEKWRFTYESYSQISKSLEVIDGIWMEIFKMPLLPI